MEIILNKKPKNPRLIEGFPGFGFVSTITTEFLIEHLNAKQIGRIESNHIMPMVAMHNSKLVDPLGIFYDPAHNLVIFHAITNVAGLEWELAEKLNALAKKLKIEPLKEGIIMGVTGALLLKSKLPMSAIFVETHSQLPDSRAAAKVIEVLDKYLNLKVDYKPLLEKAEQFESKLKTLMQQKNKAEEEKDKKELSYFG